MGQGIFTPMSSLDQILLADFFLEKFQTLLEVIFEIKWVILTPRLAFFLLSNPRPDRVKTFFANFAQYSF